MPKFIATHGVSFANLDIAFAYDEDLSAGKSANPATGTGRVYSVDLDAKQAAELKKLDSKVLAEYGITEAPKASSNDES